MYFAFSCSTDKWSYLNMIALQQWLLFIFNYDLLILKIQQWTTHTLPHIHSFSFVRSSLINSFWELGWKKDGNCFKTNKRYDHKSIPYRIVSFTHYYWSSLLNGSDHIYGFSFTYFICIWHKYWKNSNIW